MAVSEESRHDLYRRLEEVLGRAEATTLMEHLPPVGWSDVATRHDVDGVRSDLDALESRLVGRLEREMRLQTWRLVTVMIAVMGAVIAAVRL